ncbi:MAG: hypothetical protein K6A74_05260 [Lachnospiraceae bacterium]|nr:hypothetical protein [Lachnospiraceae bacterium]
MEQQKKIKKFILSLGITAVGIFLLLIFLVAWIDPFFHYHKPLSFFPYKVDNQLSANAGMAKNFDYDGILTGSSMVSNFDLKKFDEVLGQKIVKLNYNGACPKDIYNILDYVFKNHEEPSVVYYGLDVYGFNGSTEEVKYPFPAYLYDDNIFNDVSYVFNKDVLVDYIIEPLTWPSEKTDLSEVYIMGYEDWQYSRENVLYYYEPSERSSVTKEQHDELMAAVKANLESNLLPYIEAHPDTEFVIFYPPYSILYWYNRILEGRLDISEEQYTYITEHLLAYDNVRVFCFCGDEEVVTDLDNYVDFNHQHRSVNDEIVNCFASGDWELTKENYRDIIKAMFDLARNYDYEADFGFENVYKAQ